MNRSSRLPVFFVTTLTVLALLVMISFAYFLPKHNINGLLQLLQQPIYDVPLAVFFVVLAVLTGFIATLTSFVIDRRDTVYYQSKLTALANQQYQASTLRTVGATATDQTIEAIRQQLIKLQQEVQIYSEQPIDVSGESKEKILEDERHRLARELHDSVSQQLFAAMMMLSALNETVKKQPNTAVFSKQVATIEKVINESQSEMRALLLHLRPTNLEGKSLKQGIDSLVKELQSKIKIDIHADLDDVKLPSGVEDNLFRIVQELFSNTLRHAKANRIDIFLKQLDQLILLKVVDDGVGFDTKMTRETGSYGLKNIKERTSAIGGQIKIISFPNEGTSVEIRIPVIKE
ncbi:sensor histidine kinase [Agrilactobacillus fermenti]|uniref:sensor histidine kinase n=1 Tax=Agrilactobacillus fermenti TaxID=2586909 RepID=UPI0038B3AA61|nr:sensor histidine kinase [Agrilactobacillus fermenti]